MTKDICNRVEESLALRLPLGSELASHMRGCKSCLQLQATSQALYTSLSPSDELPLGLSARLTAQVQGRLRQGRRPQGLLYISLGIAGLVAVALFAFRANREPKTPTSQLDTVEAPVRETRSTSAPQPDKPAPPQEPDLVEELALLEDFSEELTLLADLEHSLAISADWENYEQPIAEISALEKELGR